MTPAEGQARREAGRRRKKVSAAMAAAAATPRSPMQRFSSCSRHCLPRRVTKAAIVRSSAFCGAAAQVFPPQMSIGNSSTRPCSYLFGESERVDAAAVALELTAGLESREELRKRSLARLSGRDTSRVQISEHSGRLPKSGCGRGQESGKAGKRSREADTKTAGVI